MTDPGTSPGGGGGGTSSGLDTAEKKELLAGFDLRSFLADSLENVENPENVKWNDGDIAAAASLLGNSSGRELSFTVSFENEPYNGSVVSGTVGYVLSVTDGAVNGYKASTSDDAGLEVDGYKLTVAMNEMVTAYGTVSVSGGKAEFTDLEAIPVPVGTDISVSLEGEEIDPRAELVQRLLEYKTYRSLAQELARREDGAGRLLYKEPTVPAEVAFTWAEIAQVVWGIGAVVVPGGIELCSRPRLQSAGIYPRKTVRER